MPKQEEGIVHTYRIDVFVVWEWVCLPSLACMGLFQAHHKPIEYGYHSNSRKLYFIIG